MMLKAKKIVMVILLTAVSMVFLSSHASATDFKININTASIEELIQLKNIDELYAKMIIEYREKYGAFTNPQDIVNVEGITQETFNMNKDAIVIVSEKKE